MLGPPVLIGDRVAYVGADEPLLAVPVVTQPPVQLGGHLHTPGPQHSPGHSQHRGHASGDYTQQHSEHSTLLTQARHVCLL